MSNRCQKRKIDIMNKHDIKRFTLRMDLKLFEIIKEEARKNKRSVAMEIEFILEQYALKNNLLDKSTSNSNQE